MSGVPTSFHLGPLVFHTYGFGLAIAAYVCYLYSRHRLARAGFELAHFFSYAVALVVSGLVGARLANVATNWSYYSGHPGRWIAVWQGGLASFGGIALALPVAVILQRHWWPGSSFARFADAMVPALVAGWALGRVLQGAEDGLLWGLLVLVERRWTTKFAGALSALAMIVWGLVRAFDEHWLLGQESHSGSIGVQFAGLALALAGVVIFLNQVLHRSRHT